jgi:hypothetical protein
MKSLKMKRESISSIFLPMRFTKYVKARTDMRQIGMDNRRKKALLASRSYPMKIPKKRLVKVNVAGCRIEETKTTARLENDVVKKTSERRIRVAQKPKRQSLIQIVELLWETLMIPPRDRNPNHIKLEKRERAIKRLKLKTGSFFRNTQ